MRHKKGLAGTLSNQAFPHHSLLLKLRLNRNFQAATQSIGDRTVLFRCLGGFLETGLVKSWHCAASGQGHGRDFGAAWADIQRTNGCDIQLLCGISSLRQSMRERHGVAFGMRGGDQFFGTGLPSGLSTREAQVTGMFCNAPLLDEAMVPCPCIRLPSQTTSARRSTCGICSSVFSFCTTRKQAAEEAVVCANTA